MDPLTRPNIVTIGALGGAVSWFVCWALARFAGEDVGAEGGIAMSTLITYALQYLDRTSKRGTAHVLQKYGGQSQDDEMAQGGP